MSKGGTIEDGSQSCAVPPTKSGLDESRAGQVIWQLASAERRWLLPKLDHLYRICYTYPSITSEIPIGDKAVRELNDFRKRHADLVAMREEVKNAKKLVPLEKENATKHAKSALVNVLVAAGCVGAAVVLFPLGGVLGELSLAVLGAGVFEGAKKSFDAFMWKKHFDEELGAKLELLTVEHTERLNELGIDFERCIADIADDHVRHAVEVTTAMRENGVDPDIHPAIAKLDNAGHFRTLVKEIAEQMISRYPDQTRRIFGPSPDKSLPGGEQRLWKYYELVALTLLADSLDHEFRQYGAEPPEATETDWTIDDFRLHVGGRVEELLNVQRENVRYECEILEHAIGIDVGSTRIAGKISEIGESGVGRELSLEQMGAPSWANDADFTLAVA